MSTVDQEDIKTRVNQQLRLADESVKNKQYDQALLIVRKVYSIDMKNMYARAYEERILALKLEEDRGRLALEAEQKAEAKIETELKKRVAEFHRAMELEAVRKKRLESREESLEDGARKASVVEQQQIVRSEMSSLEMTVKKNLEDLETRLADQVQQIVGRPGDGPSRGSMSPDQVREFYQSKIDLMRRHYEDARMSRRVILQDTYAKLMKENERAREELVQRMNEERGALLKREAEKTRQLSLDAYRSLLTSMEELQIQQPYHETLLQALRIPFSITDEEHRDLKRKVQFARYASVLRGVWEKGKPTEEDLVSLKSLQSLYQLSDEEHSSLTKSVKKELGLPDEDAVILVLDDDPVLQKFLVHILRQTYRTVLTAKNVDEAVAEAKQGHPSLILSDLHLGPESISGVTFYEKIQQNEYGESLKGIPFVLMSALRDEFFVKSAKGLGIKTFLPKPFTKHELEAAVKEALS